LSSTLVFDIETVPDVELGRKLLSLSDLPAEEVASAMFDDSLAKRGSTFLPHHWQQIVAISVVIQTKQETKFWSLGSPDSDEYELLTRFFQGVEKYRPTLVSWNGTAFDLPVMHYRLLRHGIQAPTYWEIGDNDNQFKWNNYLNRYHYRHLDVMDLLASYTGRANAKLDEVAQLLDLPGKMGIAGGDVWQYYLDGKITLIRDYCETDVLNTYLVFLRLQYIRGILSSLDYVELQQRLVNSFTNSQNPSIEKFNTEFKPFIPATITDKNII